MLISTNDIVLKTGISKTTLWRYRKKFSDFPKPVVLNPTFIRWVSKEIDDWFLNRRSLSSNCLIYSDSSKRNKRKGREGSRERTIEGSDWTEE